ncbi:MAG TPA: thiol-disulfide oxidoreductase DCC family protein [Pyrinomonadaceae bacterium]
MGAVVLFDGVCNFCDASVNFVIDHDREGYFKFAPLQSEAGLKLAAEYGLRSETAAKNAAGDDLIPIDSVILIEDGKAYTHSTAALRIARRLGAPWSWFYVLIVIPAPVRDYLYRLFAKYRYRFFGRKDECMLPSPEVRARFLT